MSSLIGLLALPMPNYFFFLATREVIRRTALKTFIIIDGKVHFINELTAMEFMWTVPLSST